jgi:hypothetical protein
MDKFIEKIELSLYGPNGQSGLIGRSQSMELNIGGKVSRAWLIGTAITVIGILSVIFIPMVTGAIKTIGIVSDRSIELKVQADMTKIGLEKIDLQHRANVELMDTRNREVHITLMTTMTRADTAIIEKIQDRDEAVRETISDLLKESEGRIKEHIDLSIKAYVRAVNGGKKVILK